MASELQTRRECLLTLSALGVSVAGCGRGGSESTDVPAPVSAPPDKLTYAAFYDYFRRRTEENPRDIEKEVMGEDWVRRRRRPETGRERWIDDTPEGADGKRPWLRYYPTDVGMSVVFNPQTLMPYRAGNEKGVLSFAETGGDGTHFSFLTEPGRPVEDLPVVVTYGGFLPRTPDGEPLRHRVVAEGLREFLCLGVPTGYFVLEDVILRPSEFISNYPAGDDFRGSDDLRKAVADLAAAFRLVRWKREQVGPRFEALAAKYQERLRTIG